VLEAISATAPVGAVARALIGKLALLNPTGTLMDCGTARAEVLLAAAGHSVRSLATVAAKVPYKLVDPRRAGRRFRKSVTRWAGREQRKRLLAGAGIIMFPRYRRSLRQAWLESGVVARYESEPARDRHPLCLSSS